MVLIDLAINVTAYVLCSIVSHMIKKKKRKTSKKEVEDKIMHRISKISIPEEVDIKKLVEEVIRELSDICEKNPDLIYSNGEISFEKSLSIPVPPIRSKESKEEAKILFRRLFESIDQRKLELGLPPEDIHTPISLPPTSLPEVIPDMDDSEWIKRLKGLPKRIEQRKGRKTA